MKVFGIAYCITNRVNGKRYIGITTKSPAVRWGAHKSDARRGIGMLIARAIAKHGADVFTFEVIASACDLTRLHDLERILITQYGTLLVNGKGYNVTIGGEGAPGHKMPPHVLESLRIINTGKVLSAETRARVSAALCGLKRSPESCARIGISKRGGKLSDETRAKMSAANKGRPNSPEAIAKISQKAKQRWAEEKWVISRGAEHYKTKPVTTPDGQFSTLRDAAEYFGVTRNVVGRRARLGKDGWGHLE